MRRLMRAAAWAVALVLVLTHTPWAGDPIEALRQAEREVSAKRLRTLGEALKQEDEERSELVKPQQIIGGAGAPDTLTVAGGTTPSGRSPDALGSGDKARSDEATRLRKNADELRARARTNERAAKGNEGKFRLAAKNADAERARASSSRSSAQQATNQTERERLEAEARQHDRTADSLAAEARETQQEAAERRTVAEGLRREAIGLERQAREMERETQSRATPTDEASRLRQNAQDIRELVEQNEREAKVAEQNARELNQLANAEKKHADSLRADAQRTQNPDERRRLESEADAADQRAKELSEEARKQQQKAAESTAIGDGLRHEAQNLELEAHQRAREAEWREALDKAKASQPPGATVPPPQTIPGHQTTTGPLSLGTVGPPEAGSQPVSADMTVVVPNRPGTIVCLPKGATVTGLDGEVIAEGPTEVLVATSKSPEEVQRLATASGVTLCFVEIDYCVIKTPLTAFRGHEHKPHPGGLHAHDAPDPPWDWGVTPPVPVVSWGGGLR